MYAETSWGRYDNAAATRWYRLAAERGYREAQYRLGLAHLQGMGVPTAAAAACQWFRKAADQGNASAELALGTMYCLGCGVAQSEAQARAWFAKAVHQGGSPGRQPRSGCVGMARPAQEACHPWPVCLQVPHISQGWNLCGVAAATMATAFHGHTADQYEVKRLCGSPPGEGTDWIIMQKSPAQRTHPATTPSGLRPRGLVNLKRWPVSQGAKAKRHSSRVLCELVADRIMKATGCSSGRS
jgi:hypothetical protein